MYCNDAMSHALPVPQLNTADLRGLQIGRDGRIFDPASGRSFQANATAAQTLRMMQEGATQEDAAMYLAAQYSAPLGTTLKAVRRLIDALKPLIPLKQHA